jgi:hypothetical protein
MAKDKILQLGTFRDRPHVWTKSQRSWVALCKDATRDFFEIPDKARNIFVVLSDQSHPESIRMRLEPDSNGSWLEVDEERVGEHSMCVCVFGEFGRWVGSRWRYLSIEIPS